MSNITAFAARGDIGKDVTVILRVVKSADKETDESTLSINKVPKFLIEQAGAMLWDSKTKTWGWNHDISHAMAVALGTVRMYTDVVAGVGIQKKSVVSEQLDYGRIQDKPVQGIATLYAQHLPYNFDQLGDEKKVAVQAQAQKKIQEHQKAMDAERHEIYKKERAGVVASLIQKYEHMAQELPRGVEVLIPAGTQGDTMEWILKTCLVWKDTHGAEHKGFETVSEIGGAFSSMEYYDIRIFIDEEGNAHQFKVVLNETRPKLLEAHLDAKGVRALAQWYEQFQKR